MKIQPFPKEAAVLLMLTVLSTWVIHAQPRAADNGASERAQRAPAQTLIYQDDFEDGDFTNADGGSGLTWDVITGNASVDSVDDSLQLGVYRGDSLIATTQRIAADEYTLSFDGRITWSTPGRIVVLYKDADNYYSVGLGGQPGVYRTLNGDELQLHDDAENLLRLPHGRGVTGAFKVYAQNTGSSVVIKADRAGDGVDYDIEVVDSDAEAVATFANTGIGMMSTGDTPDPPWFYIDNVAVHDGLVEDTYEPTTYYVDKHHAQASDDNPGTEDLPWATIQKAADSVKAGDTVIVKSGTYEERVAFASGTRGAPGQVITFKAQPSRSVTMWGFYTRYAHYLRIEGFNITTDASLTGWTERDGVYIRSDHVEIVDNYLYDLRGSAIGGNSDGAYAARNTIYRCQAGLGISGSNWLVEENEVERLFDHGGGDCDYSRFFGDNHVIRNNHFHGTQFGEVGDAHVDCFQTFDNNGETGHNVTVEGNVCTDFHQGFMGEAHYYHDIDHITFKNNVFAHGGAWGLCVQDISYLTAINNTFVDIQYHGIGLSGEYAHHAVIKNNIFYDMGTSYWFPENSGSVGDYNLIYDAQDPPMSGAHDLTGLDPRFVDPASDDFHLKSESPAVDAGEPLAEVDVDHDGTSRPQGADWDIGAFEFAPSLVLHGRPGDQSIHLTWQVNVTTPLTSTWQIGYRSETGTAAFPAVTIPTSTVRAHTLSGLTNYVWYTVALTGTLVPGPPNGLDSPSLLTDMVKVMPTDLAVYLPLVVRQSEGLALRQQ